MGLVTELVLALPVLPALGWVMKNRRRSSSWFCSWMDIALNISDRWFYFIHRVNSNDACVARDREGRFSGFFYRSEKE